MHKVLKNVEPFVRSYLGDAFCFSIINDKAFESGWIFDKYIHLAYTPQDGQIKYADYDYYEFVPDQGVFVKSFIEYPYEYSTLNFIVRQITEMIDHNEYCFALWDETIVTNCLFGECCEGQYEHGCFIYGYDSEEQMFYTEGYFDNEKWEHYTIPYDVFYKAVSYCPEKGEIAFISYKEVMDYEWKLDDTKVKRELEVYLKNSFSKEETNCFDVSAIYHFFSSLHMGERIHYPSLYCIFEHKTLFWKRLVYLAKHGWSIDENVIDVSKKLMNEYRKIMLLGLAYNVNFETTLFEQMRYKVKQAIETEEKSLVCLRNTIF